MDTTQTAITPEFPKYEYAFKVVNMLFESAQIEVEYTPKDTRLLKLTYFLPIMPDFDPNKIAEYVDKWAPNDKWFAQETILNHAAAVVGTSS